ncbi:MAG TPA: phosphoribosylformylglycinamidine cyclo-ligase [Anaerovoracaceae bacterium]|nr:phosphoribosylformylglycinamidine cyclo-ligase [Anaerovoracaceae bacterium]
MKIFSGSYKEAGVDITAGYKAVELMKNHVAKTMVFGKTSEVGGFGGIFEPNMEGIQKPVLVSGTDGVGTKLKLAFLMDKHDSVGIDCVAMCVNDVLCVGAEPMFFLDYIAVGKNEPERVADIVKGIAEGCIQSKCCLTGGETAEMPGFYGEDEYDLAGFTVGIADKSKLIDSKNVKEGDAIIALPSSGVHSNGFSLVRKVFDVENTDLNRKPDMLKGNSLGKTLLTPTKIYVKPMSELFKEITPAGVAHITGGGFYENIPRTLPKGLTAKIKKDDVKVLPIFKLIMEEGNIPEKDMFNTFNMGVGMIVIVPKKDEEKAIKILKDNGEEAYHLGEVINGDEGVILW